MPLKQQIFKGALIYKLVLITIIKGQIVKCTKNQSKTRLTGWKYQLILNHIEMIDLIIVIINNPYYTNSFILSMLHTTDNEVVLSYYFLKNWDF